MQTFIRIDRNRGGSDISYKAASGKLKAKNVTPVTINKAIKASREKLSWVKPIH